jgi:hypothetical protein
MQACTLKRARCTLLFVKSIGCIQRGAAALWPLCKVIHILPTMGRAGKGVRACHTHEVVPVIRQIHRENSAHSNSPFKRTFSIAYSRAACVNICARSRDRCETRTLCELFFVKVSHAPVFVPAAELNKVDQN